MLLIYECPLYAYSVRPFVRLPQTVTEERLKKLLNLKYDYTSTRYSLQQKNPIDIMRVWT